MLNSGATALCWIEVCHWIDAHGEIANVDTLKASRMLAAWVAQELLEPLPDRAKRNTAYSRPSQPADQASLLSEAKDNKLLLCETSKKSL